MIPQVNQTTRWDQQHKSISFVVAHLQPTHSIEQKSSLDLQ